VAFGSGLEAPEDISESAKRKILSENAKRFYRLD
jgi:predicted TIM-barrel fold metal-dependent hydrolase